MLGCWAACGHLWACSWAWSCLSCCMQMEAGSSAVGRGEMLAGITTGWLQGTACAGNPCVDSQRDAAASLNLGLKLAVKNPQMPLGAHPGSFWSLGLQGVVCEGSPWLLCGYLGRGKQTGKVQGAVWLQVPCRGDKVRAALMLLPSPRRLCPALGHFSAKGGRGLLCPSGFLHLSSGSREPLTFTGWFHPAQFVPCTFLSLREKVGSCVAPTQAPPGSAQPTEAGKQ